MGERSSRSCRAIATLICLAVLAVAGCVGPGAVQTGQSAAPNQSIYQPDPARGPCGEALALNVRAALTGGSDLACTSGPLASGSPWPVSIRAAAQAFREFTRESSLQFEVGGPFDGAGGRQYTLNGSGADAAGLFVSGTVDADSGRVTSVYFTPRAVDGPGLQVVSKETAITDAVQYASAHSIDISGLSSFAEPTEFGWEITWERLIGDVGVAPRVVITVNWTAGNVMSYNELRPDLGMPPAPAISRAQAEAVATNTWLASPVVEDARLRLEPWGAKGPTLVWEVYVSGKGDRTDGPTYITTRVDATTGQAV